MYFIQLVKFKKKPTREVIAQNLKWLEMGAKEGIKSHGIYWTLGRYDVIAIFEAPNEKAAMKHSIRFGDNVSTESLVAVPAEEARKLAE